MRDNIHIEKLRVRCHIGATEGERKRKQKIVLDLILFADLHGSRIKDDLSKTVDYSLLAKAVIREVETSRFHLIESLAEMVADFCLAHSPVSEVRVRIVKPGAVREAGGVSVEITRSS
ncbi:MAG TPA: dihydroneopterin aldolase [Spirochaetia bacterium]|nr:dihydroneopterin aldolase [Spirochaetia bacterium]